MFLPFFGIKYLKSTWGKSNVQQLFRHRIENSNIVDFMDNIFLWKFQDDLWAYYLNIDNAAQCFPLSSFYFFKLSNPSTNLLNAPSVRSTGVAYEKRIQSPPKGEKKAPGTTATP